MSAVSLRRAWTVITKRRADHEAGELLQGFLSHALFQQELRRERARADRRQSCFTVISFDVEGPDSARPQAFRSIASALNARTRTTDTKGWYGDKPAVILEDMSPVHAARLLKAVEDLHRKHVPEARLVSAVYGYPHTEWFEARVGGQQRALENQMALSNFDAQMQAGA